MAKLLITPKKKLVALQYFRQYYSVGYIRALLDLRERGLSEEEARKIIEELYEEGLLRVNKKLGVIDYVPKFKEFESKPKEEKEEAVASTKPKSHIDWIEDTLKHDNVNEAVREALEDVKEELEGRQKVIEREKERLSVSEEELLEFLREPKTPKEIHDKFGSEGLKLCNLLRLEGKIKKEKIAGAWYYYVP